MTRYIERYRNGVQNAEIAASGREYFGLTQSDYEGRRKYGSYNSLTILQAGTGAYTVLLDGLDNRKFSIPSTGAFNITPDEGVFFDFVIIENPSSTTAIDAGDISVGYAIAQPLPEVR